MARLGMQMAPWVPQGMWAWVKVVPRATRRSMFGVDMALLPNARMVSKRWSSVKNSRMLGCLDRGICFAAWSKRLIEPQEGLRPVLDEWIGYARARCIPIGSKRRG